jgi:outer membrane cobalamin receptor
VVVAPARDSLLAPPPRDSSTPDSALVSLARDSTLLSASDSARVATARDSVALARATRGVQDTVTVLPPIQVETGRPDVPTRATATQVRLDRNQIQRFIPATPSDALIAAPGVELIRTSPWATRVSVRGYSGERVLLMVDGVRLNSGRGHGALSSLVGVDKLFQVDVSPGAASAQYGSDAIGGVVNLVTHRDLLAHREFPQSRRHPSQFLLTLVLEKDLPKFEADALLSAERGQ